MGKPFIDITGQKFGRLTVIGRAKSEDGGRTKWDCKCDCGSKVVVVGYSLKNGNTSSCGCFSREVKLTRFEQGRIDLIGKTFGRLTVESVSHIEDNRKTFYNCICECGNSVVTVVGNLKHGHSRSCGCLIREVGLARNEAFRKAMIDRRFGRLTVVSVDTVRKGGTTYLCRCDCGNDTVVLGTSLTTGGTSSCGCLRAELHSERVKTHGLSDHRLYAIYNGIIQRCSNPNVSGYQYYGGRGISMCDEWRNDFMTFFNWSMENGYRDDLTIDRYPDLSGNYSPNNCRWSTIAEQNQNKTNIKMSEEKVEKIREDRRSQMTIAAEYGISQSTVSAIKTRRTWKT